jgi:hypothetical protein
MFNFFPFISKLHPCFKFLTIWQNIHTCDQIFPWSSNVCSKNFLSMWYKLFLKNSFRLMCSCSFVRCSKSCVHKLTLLGWIQICSWVFFVTCLKQKLNYRHNWSLI